MKARYKYTNKHIKCMAEHDFTMLKVVVVMALIGAILILSGPLTTYIQHKQQKPIPFAKMASPDYGSFTIFYAELKEMPEKLVNGYYGARIGDDMLILQVGDSYAEYKIRAELEAKGSTTIHGTLRRVDKKNSLLAGEIDNFYQKNGYSRKADPNDFGYWCLECIDGSIMSEAVKAHPVGFVFGITGLILALLFSGMEGYFGALLYLRPICGSVKYTPEEIDEQANMEDARWVSGLGVCLAPKIMIGTARGIAVVEYGDIAKISIGNGVKLRSAGRGRSGRDRDGVKEYSAYDIYYIVVKTKRGKRIFFSEDTRCSGSNYDEIYKRCRELNPDVVIIEPDQK